MGFFFTMLYILTAYLAPVTLFGPLADYHIEIVIAVLALICSMFSGTNSGVMKLTQTWAIFGLCVSVACSLIFNHWVGGSVKALMQFLPDAITFFLVVMNFNKKWHFQALAAMLFFVAMFIAIHSQIDWYTAHYTTGYLMRQMVSEELNTYVIRIKGLAFLGDPNDYAQFMVALIPCMFFFWKKGSAFANFLFVYVPIGGIIYALYLSHSRGGMVALMAVCIVAGRKKIGILPAVVIGLVAFAGMTVLGFSGGRDVGASEDRLAAWSRGILLIRSHPVFGIGFQGFSDYNDITAHNTFVVCAAELGLVGAFCFVILTLITVRNVYVAAKDPEEDARDRQKKIDKLDARNPFLHGVPGLSGSGLTPATIPLGAQNHQFSGAGMPFVLPPEPLAATGGRPSSRQFGFGEDDEEAREQETSEIRRMAGLMVISFAGFLTAGWFLSRAYTMVYYVNAGMAAAIYKMALDRGIAPPPMPIRDAMKLTAKIVLGLLIVIYLSVRFDHMMPH